MRGRKLSLIRNRGINVNSLVSLSFPLGATTTRIKAANGLVAGNSVIPAAINTGTTEHFIRSMRNPYKDSNDRLLRVPSIVISNVRRSQGVNHRETRISEEARSDCCKSPESPTSVRVHNFSAGRHPIRGKNEKSPAKNGRVALI